MNLDTSTWPELLSGWGFIEMAITWLLIIAIFCVISIGAGFITRLTSINILGPSLAQTHPDIVQALDWWIAVMRTVAYMLVVINISAFIMGDMETLLMTVGVESLVWVAVIHLLTEVMRVTMYGPGRTPPQLNLVTGR